MIRKIIQIDEQKCNGCGAAPKPAVEKSLWQSGMLPPRQVVTVGRSSA